MDSRFAQELDDEWHQFWTHLPGHHRTSAAQAAATATIETATPEEPVISVAELEADARNLVAKFEAVDKAAQAKLEAVQANPATAEAFDIIHALSGYDPGPVFRGLLAAMKALVPAAAAPEPAPSFTPAGPQVGGQA